MDYNQYFVIDEIESKLDEADRGAAANDVRYTLEEVVERVKARLNEE